MYDRMLSFWGITLVMPICRRLRPFSLCSALVCVCLSLSISLALLLYSNSPHFVIFHQSENVRDEAVVSRKKRTTERP